MKNKNRVCCINYVILRDVSRPSLYCEEVKSKEDTSILGRCSWNAVTFTADILNPLDYTGDFSQVTLIANPEEKWIFFDVKIALMPTSTLNENQFVMIFNQCTKEKNE